MAVLRIGGTENYISSSLLWFVDSVKRALCKKKKQKNKKTKKQKQKQKWKLIRKYVNHMIMYLSSKPYDNVFI